MSQSDPTRPSPAPGAQRRGAQMYAIPGAVFLVLIVALVAFLLTRGDDEAGQSSGEASRVETQLDTTAQFLRGTGDVAALAAATCTEAPETGEFDCVPRGALAGQAVRVVANGTTLAKRLAGRQPAEAPRAATAVASALRLDARARSIDVPRYSCATTARIGPGGSTEAGSATGFLCYAADVVRGAADGASEGTQPADLAARYIEYGPAGTVIRDYAVTPG